MLKVGKLIKDSPVRWDAAYKVFMGACETARPRFYEEFLENNIPVPTPRQDGGDVRVLSIGSGSGEDKCITVTECYIIICMYKCIVRQ